jgi:hypothetical protein
MGVAQRFFEMGKRRPSDVLDEAGGRMDIERIEILL